MMVCIPPHYREANISVHTSHFANVLQEIVYHFYLVLNYPYMKAHCKLVESKELTGLPKTQTSTVVRKYIFPIKISSDQWLSYPVPKYPENL